MSCFNQCVHIDINEDIIKQAVSDEQNIQRQKGFQNKTTKLMSMDRDYVGSIAQNSVFEYFRQIEIDIDTTPYFDKSINQDTCDFIHRGRNDIKGSPTKGKWNEVRPYTSFLLSDHQREKEVDWYTFVKVDLDHNVAHIAGVISYKDFLELSQPVNHTNLKHPCHNILAKDLLPFRKYAYGT